MRLLKPEHPWVKHLDASQDIPWLGKAVSPLVVKQGDVLLGDSAGRTALVQIPVGRGRLIYCGWSPAADIPNGRTEVTISDEARFAEQMQVITNMVSELLPLK